MSGENRGKQYPKTEINISVRSLVEVTSRSGDLEQGFVGSNRSVEGIRGHRNVQNSRPENYIREVPIQYVIESNEILLTISGRIDGVLEGNDGVLIEEIKTTYVDDAGLKMNENNSAWAQAKTYAFIYAKEHNLDEIHCQLTFYHLITFKTFELRRSFKINELEVFFKNLLDKYLKGVEKIIHWCTLRDDSIADLAFPFPQYRSGQRDMAIHVYRTIKRSSRLFLQAATGIGKTMAALFPAIKAMGEGYGPKIFFLTARTTGRAAAEQALNELRQKGLRLKSISITAKDKICPNPEKTCSAEECVFARGYYDRVDDAVGEIFDQRDAFSPEMIEITARKNQICPFEFSLDLALWADCIICDYNYVFDPRVYLRRFFLEKDTEYTLLIDEAHNLVDRAREMFSAELRKQIFLDVRRPFKERLPAIYKSIGKVNSWFIAARKKCEENAGFFSQKEAPGDLYPALKHFRKLAEDWFAKNIKTDFREDLLNLYFDVHNFLRISDEYNGGHVTRYRKERNDLYLKLVCLDPSEHLGKILIKCGGVVFFSATMTPAGYFKRILGCGETAAWLDLPSPFPPENFLLLIANRISTYYRHRFRTKEAVLRILQTVINAKHGNYICYFPSYEYMTMIYDDFFRECPCIDIILQTPDMSEDDRASFLVRFSEENPKTLVGFAVMGGIFGEAIDLVGDRLSGAIIVGVGLPGITKERDLIKEYFSRVSRMGFEFAYLYPGMIKVLQAAGRVIRSETDRGVVLLIDDRFATNRYTPLFPAGWNPTVVSDNQSLKQELARFWEPS